MCVININELVDLSLNKTQEFHQMAASDTDLGDIVLKNNYLFSFV